MLNRRRTRAQRGFTLLELMVVVAIIGLIASIAIPGYLKFTAQAARSEAITTVSDIARLLNQAYYANNGSYAPVGASGAFSAAWNPPGSPGTNGSWDSTLSGWTDLPYSSDNSLRMRYSYAVSADQHSVTIYACGNMDQIPKPASSSCPNVSGVQHSGNYFYRLDFKDGEPSTAPTEIPAF